MNRFKVIILLVIPCILLLISSKAVFAADRTVLWSGFYAPQLNDQLITTLAGNHLNGFNFQDESGAATFGNGGPGRRSGADYDRFVNKIVDINNKARVSGMDSLFITVFAADGGALIDPNNEVPYVNTFRELAKFAHLTHIKGILIDAEPYGGCACWSGGGNYYVLGQHIAQGINAFDTSIDILMAPHLNADPGYAHYTDFAHGMASVLGSRLTILPEAPGYYTSDTNIISQQFSEQVGMAGGATVGMSWWTGGDGAAAISYDRQISQKYSFIYTQDMQGWITGGNGIGAIASSVLPALTPLPPIQVTPGATTLSAPTNLTASCSNGTVNFSWSPVSGADHYLVRVDADPQGNLTDCNAPFGNDYCNDNVSGTSFQRPGSVGTSYTWWVHGANSSGLGTRSDLATVTCTQTPVHNAADFNNDGHVNIADFWLMVGTIGLQKPGPQDLNSDGIINIFDYNQFITNYGK